MLPADIARSERADVVVVGGGPAGSATAMRLAREGLHVVQLERRVFGAPENDRFRSGEGILPSTMRALERLGLAGDADTWTLQQATGVRIRWPNGDVTLDRFPAECCIRALDREFFDTALWCEARAAGVDGRCNWSVQRLLVEGAKVCGLTARDPDGENVVLHAPLVVDAGGRNAPSILQFGLRQAEAADDVVVVVLFFDHVPELRDDVWEMHFFGEGEPSVMQGARIAEGLVRFGLGASLRLKLGSGMKPEAFFWQRLREYPQLEARLRAARVVRPAYARARLGYRTVAIARSGLLLVGDATGYLNPILGDGILMALRSAELASEVAMQAFAHRDFSMKQLAVYERQWRRTRRPRVAIGRILMAMHRRPQVVDRLGHVTSLRRMLLNTLMRP